MNEDVEISRHATAPEVPTSLSVIVPCFNESRSLEQIVERILAVDLSGLDLEVLIVDDASQDASYDIAKRLSDGDTRIRLVGHESNQGKGAAVRTGFRHFTGDLVMIQDADLEYDPSEYPDLLKPILDGRADVVYGTRFTNQKTHQVPYKLHTLGNRALTWLSNLCTGARLTDMETCYKVFKRDVVATIDIQEDRFGFEPEITAKICKLRPRPRIEEVAISYHGRSFDEGKKITWIDGIRAVYCILRYNFFR